MLDNAKLVLARLECRGPLGGEGGWGGGGVEEKKKNKVGEILLISSCRFPFLYLTMAPLFCLTHSIFVYFLSFDMRMKKTLKGRPRRRGE